MKYTEKIAKKLNSLLIKTYEAEHVYKLGAERAEKPLIRNILKGLEQQRHTFGQELEEEIRAYGHLPAKKGDQQLPAGRNSLATPGEVGKVQRSSLQVYESLLKDPETNFPPPTERILINQKKGILASWDSRLPVHIL